MGAHNTRLAEDISLLSNILFTESGFNQETHADESLNSVFFSGYNPRSRLRLELFPQFNLEAWDRERFEAPQLGPVRVVGEGIHRRQLVTIKLIYRKPSQLDSDAFDGIVAVLTDFERGLPPDASDTINPLVVIEGSRWKVNKLRSYKSPSGPDLCRVISYDLSFL